MENKEYLLAIRKNHNVYDPVEWKQFLGYKGQNINNLKDIDDFTSNINESYLRSLLVKLNMRTKEEVDKNFNIIHYENKAVRELAFGPMFKENADFRTPEAIIEFLKQNRYDKDILNRIYNLFRYFNKTMEQSPAFKDFIQGINNLDPNNLEVLNNLYYIDYFELRNLGIYISKNLVTKEINNITELPQIEIDDNTIIKEKELIKEIKEVA